MKLKHTLLILFVGLFALLLTGCGGGNSAAWPGITVVEDTIYLADGLYVYAVNLNDGRELTAGDKPLRFTVANNAQVLFFAPPVLTPDGQLIIGSAGHSHAIISVDPETFVENWKFNNAEDIYVGSALVANDRIYAPNGDGNLYVLDLQGNLQATVSAEHGFWSQPVTNGEMVFATSLDHSVYAFSIEGSSTLWSTELDSSIISSPALSADGRVLFVGTVNKTIYALDADSGDILWDQTLDGAVWGAPVADGDTIYVAVTIVKEEGKLYALDAATGATRWVFETDGAMAGAPLLRPDSVVVATETGAVYSVTKEGAQDWKQTFEHNFYFGPVTAGDLILLAPSQSPVFLFAIDENGAKKWDFTPGK